MTEQARLNEEAKQRKEFSSRALLPADDVKIDLPSFYENSQEMISNSETWRLPRFSRNPVKDGVFFDDVPALQARRFLQDRFKQSFSDMHAESFGSFKEVSLHYVDVLSKMGKLDKSTEKNFRQLHSRLNGRPQNDTEVFNQMIAAIDDLRNESANG